VLGLRGLKRKNGGTNESRKKKVRGINYRKTKRWKEKQTKKKSSAQLGEPTGKQGVKGRCIFVTDANCPQGRGGGEKNKAPHKETNCNTEVTHNKLNATKRGKNTNQVLRGGGKGERFIGWG